MTCLIFAEQKRGHSVHLAVDGWTAPITAAFLGVVVVWHDKGEIHRCVLEFIRYGFIRLRLIKILTNI